MSDKKSKKPKDPRGKMVSGIILLGIGVLFLLNNFDIIDIDQSWPFILIIIGVALLIGTMFRKRDSESDGLTPPIV